jgi:shikimate 5-dehydrogenase
MEKLLENKTAVIYGAGGAIGGAAARTFAREGAKVFLAGRTGAKLEAVARHMVKRGSGVILTLSTPGARMTGQGFLGNGVASAAIVNLTCGSLVD